MYIKHCTTSPLHSGFGYLCKYRRNARVPLTDFHSWDFAMLYAFGGVWGGWGGGGGFWRLIVDTIVLRPAHPRHWRFLILRIASNVVLYAFFRAQVSDLGQLPSFEFKMHWLKPPNNLVRNWSCGFLWSFPCVRGWSCCLGYVILGDYCVFPAFSKTCLQGGGSGSLGALCALYGLIEGAYKRNILCSPMHLSHVKPLQASCLSRFQYVL